MSILNSLDLAPAIDKETINPKRQKLLKRLDVQLKMAKAEFEGLDYVPTKEKFKVDNDSGAKTRVTIQRNIGRWWKKIDNIYFLQIRYGNKALELSKGNFSIKIEKETQLVPTLEKVISAVAQGELDELLAKAGKPIK